MLNVAPDKTNNVVEQKKDTSCVFVTAVPSLSMCQIEEIFHNSENLYSQFMFAYRLAGKEESGV